MSNIASSSRLTILSILATRHSPTLRQSGQTSQLGCAAFLICTQGRRANMRVSLDSAKSLRNPYGTCTLRSEAPGRAGQGGAE